MSPFLASSSRWNPTPEQLMILEEMYKGGVRTPNASQIQQITAHLSHYGKIEGKNVFYWFQNHKARDRQRLRRKLSKLQLYHNIMLHHHNHDHTTTPVTQLSHHPSSIGIFQQGGVIHNPSLHMDNSYTSKLNQIPAFKFQLDNDRTIMKSYNCDWTTMLDVGPHTCTKPLETLDLFPVTSQETLKKTSSNLNISNLPLHLPTNPQ